MIDAQWLPLLYAVLLLAAGLALLVLEFFIVSFGLISIAALACAIAAVYFAFQLGPLIAYSFIVIAIVLSIFILRWGLRKVQTSSLVPKAEITSDAGYHHVAERLGVEIGSSGVLMTKAMPSGRARFSGGECDVQVRSGSLDRDTRIVVRHIDGPIIFVSAADTN